MTPPVLIQNQSLLYHLTCMDNIESIISTGLRSRASLGENFVDVADGEIIQGRGVHTLEQKVPFHFFANNPFDGRVKADHKDKDFCMITVSRNFARDNRWEIIPQHPLAAVNGLRLMDYDSGFAAINWELMNQRDYKNAESKSVCMAECLSPMTVAAENFHAIYVKDEQAKAYIEGLLSAANLTKFVNINTYMC
ncbi:DUF4433 domain-containing protein [Serratia plymuthica]|uniref:DarT ssDNA thymidine ADP-ribosyltransferase family protein n=1 Tax=Serratia plymuthica TaxID=82996 RepID=UPI001F53B0B3|nr:DarT ssDNA thymidine ADP-ribosyltransferase family protein [Serratia plymuthica]UNK25914.1 DUF4433 domain-containing protein [Serratia plymuthica]